MSEPNAAATGTIALGDGLEVNRLGFGAMRITGEGVWGEPPDADLAKAVLRRAVELGVNLIDTADSYGPEVSERLIGEALHPYPDELVIATKAGLTRSGPGQWHRAGDPERIKQCVDGSLERLKLDRIDLYQLHAEDPEVPLEDSLGAFAELREAGKVRLIGVCNLDTAQLERARKVVPDVVSVQNQYNLTYRDSEDVLDRCEADGLAFIPWFPLATGDLASADSPLIAIAREHDAAPGQVALAWLLARSPAMLPIPGTGSVEHLEENVAAAALELSDDEAEALERAVA